ncbi:MAG: FtsQ-type POTRA domain-containing protein [Clostridia bacterium]
MAEKVNSKRKSNFSHLPVQMFIIFVLVIGAFMLCTIVFFKTENIEITVSDEYDVQDIIDVLDIEYGDNLFFLNTTAMEKEIFNAFPYIENVKVVKKLPSTLSITYSIAQVCYSVEYEGNYVYVSETGKLLELVSFVAGESIQVNVGEIEDVDGYLSIIDEDVANDFDEIMQLYLDGDLDEITDIDFSNKYELTMVYDDRVTFALGGLSDLSFKIQFGLQVIDSGQIAASESGTLDLSLGRESNRAYFMSDALIAAYSSTTEEEETIIAGRG